MNLTALQSAAPTELNIQLRFQPFAGPQLVRDYFDAAPALAPFFAGFPWDPGAVQRVAADVQSRFPQATRRAMSEAIHATTPAAAAKLESIAAGDGFFVTTGQQAGLFTGPLFTVYKALTAIKLADRLEAQLGVPVAPLFWVAADDHDFAEVNHAFVFGTDNEAHRVELPGPPDDARSMSRHILDDSIGDALSALAAQLPANEFAEQALLWAKEAYAPGHSMAAAFSLMVTRLFEKHNFLITSSAHPVVKSLAVPVILRELERSSEHEAAVRRQTDRLVAAGYHEQVSVRAGAANVSYEDDDGRDRLIHEDGGWHLSRTKRRLESMEINDLLTQQPQRFSPNVLLRPIVSSAVFPTLAYVGGPAEISYFAQIGCLFDSHEVPMPLVFPRASIDVVEHKVQKVLDKFGLDPLDVRKPFDQLTSQVMREDLPESVTETVERLRVLIAEGYADLVAATESIDPTLRGPLESARNTSHKALADVEKKIVSHLKKKNEIGVEQLRKASVNLYPTGAPQERVISAISYFARYGPAFIDAVAAQLDVSASASASDWSGVRCS